MWLWMVVNKWTAKRDKGSSLRLIWGIIPEFPRTWQKPRKSSQDSGSSGRYVHPGSSILHTTEMANTNITEGIRECTLHCRTRKTHCNKHIRERIRTAHETQHTPYRHIQRNILHILWHAGIPFRIMHNPKMTATSTVVRADSKKEHLCQSSHAPRPVLLGSEDLQNRQAEVILSHQAFLLHLSRNLFTGSPETLSQAAAAVATIAKTT